MDPFLQHVLLIYNMSCYPGKYFIFLIEVFKSLFDGSETYNDREANDLSLLAYDMVYPLTQYSDPITEPQFQVITGWFQEPK